MLEQWFDVSKKIPKEELELALDQMMLYAYKDGLDPNSKDVKEELRNFKKTVQEHNKRFPVDFNKNIKNIIAYSFNDNDLIEVNNIEKSNLSTDNKRKEINKILRKISKEELNIIVVGGDSYFFDIDSNNVMQKKDNGKTIILGKGDIKLECRKSKRQKLYFHGVIKTQRFIDQNFKG